MARSGPDRLYHFTCAHGARRIGRHNCLIIPQIEHPLLHIKVSWFTELAEPDRTATGLTHNFTRCDRMAFRYVVTDLSRCLPWPGSPERRHASRHGEPGALADLESEGDPEHWWISGCAVAAQFDADYATARIHSEVAF